MYYNPFDDIWEPIEGFPEYCVSISGMVGSLYKKNELTLLKPYATKHGHLVVDLHKDGQKYHKYVHRLVAEAFIPNPYNLPMVRHLNGYPDDNDITNLAWGTQVDNMQDAIELGTFRYFSDEDREQAMSIRRCPIIAINLDTGEEIHFVSQQEAARVLGVNQSDISNVINGKRRRSHRWTFEEVRHD